MFVTLNCSEKSLKMLEILENEKRNTLSHLFHQGGSSSLIKQYAKELKHIGLLSSKKNLKNFLFAIKKMRKVIGLNFKEYVSLRKFALEAQKSFSPVRKEKDHFPPNDLYRFAKHEYIQSLSPSKRPVWKIPRTKHKMAISTGSKKTSVAFRKKQRALFFEGSYAMAIQNYLKKYIDDEIIKAENKTLIIDNLKKCVKVSLLTVGEFKECLIILGVKNASNFSPFRNRP